MVHRLEKPSRCPPRQLRRHLGEAIRSAYDVGRSCISDTASQIRSVYRTIELSQGFEGPIATNEGFFYGLDTLPLFVAVVVYCPFWPGRFIPPSPSFSISNMEAAPEKSMASQESDGRA